MSKRIYLEGKRFNRWFVISYEYNFQNHSFYSCKCDCGTLRIVSGNYLKKGSSKSCGCFQKDTKALQKKNNALRIQVKLIHHSMMQRCYEKRSKSYKYYGARGITVCKEWHDANTYADFILNSEWRPHLQIDRTNNDGNYEPNNVRFVTRSVNIKNSSGITAWKKRTRNAKGQWSS